MTYETLHPAIQAAFWLAALLPYAAWWAGDWVGRWVRGKFISFTNKKVNNGIHIQRKKNG